MKCKLNSRYCIFVTNLSVSRTHIRQGRIRPAPLTHRSRRIRQEHTHTLTHTLTHDIPEGRSIYKYTHTQLLPTGQWIHTQPNPAGCLLLAHTHTAATHTLALQGGLIDSSPDGGWQQLMFPLISSSCCLGQVTPTGAMVSTPRALPLHSHMAVCVCVFVLMFICMCLSRRK